MRNKENEGIDFDKDILPILKPIIEEEADDWFNNYDIEPSKTEEVESESRDGFMAFTDGGYTVRGYSPAMHLLQYNIPKELENYLDNIRKDSYDYAYDEFMDEYWNKDLDKELGHPRNYDDLIIILDKLDYNSKYEFSIDDLDNFEYEYSEELDAQLILEVLLYYPDNRNNRINFRENTCYVSATFNWDSYGRSVEGSEVFGEEEFTFQDENDFKKQISRAIQKAIKNVESK